MLIDQMSFFDLGADALEGTSEVEIERAAAAASFDLRSYDDYILFFSGGKDSIACALHLIEQGIRPELWHHDIDGRAGNFFDWPVTPAYCDAFAKAFGLKIYHSWREGGLKGELLKENARTQGVSFETPDGIGRSGGETGTISTRRKFPALGADLRSRWCSPVVKIDVGSIAIRNQDRFVGRRVLVITGERAQESPNRARYAVVEHDRTHQPGPRARRHVDHYRPIHAWTEQQVWDILCRHRVSPHPCYLLGWSRASCMTCIFGSASQWASIREIAPVRFAELCALETEFGFTLRKGMTLSQLADRGTPYPMDPAIVALALSETYDVPIIASDWKMPSGAFGEASGPS